MFLNMSIDQCNSLFAMALVTISIVWLSFGIADLMATESE